MMEIPVKYNFHGDRQRCEALYGQARRVSSILDRLMALGGQEQHAIKFVPYPGALIVARKFFGTRIVDVYAGEGARRAQRIIEDIACLCLPFFSMGVVVGLYPTVPVKGVNPETGEYLQETTEQFEARVEAYYDNLRDIKFTYDVAVCTGNGYVLCVDIQDVNLGKYYIDQFVLVSLGANDEDFAEERFSCDRKCLMKPQPIALSVSPVHIPGFMKKWIRRTRREV